MFILFNPANLVKAYRSSCINSAWSEQMEQHEQLRGLVVGPAGLGQLLDGKSPATIKTALYRRPDTLPPPIRLAGTKTGPLWLVEDVIVWLRARTLKVGELYRGEKDRAAVARAAKARAAIPGRRGRPSQVEQVAAERAGCSVPELRKRDADGVVQS